MRHMTNQAKQTFVISVVTVYRVVILGMLSVILWSGNEVYQEFKEDYKQTKNEIRKHDSDIKAIKMKIGMPSVERASMFP